jgi:hypothetical protein
MAQYHYEMFGNLIYGEALTYEELIEHEQSLRGALSAYLRDSGASHIDFQPLGDALSMQCIFAADQRAEDFETVADAVARLSGQHMEGRLIFLCRDLNTLYCFFFVNESCQGGRLTLPSPHQGLAQTPPEMQYANAEDRKAPA